MADPPTTAQTLSPFRKAVFGLGDHSVNIALSCLSLVYFTFLVTVAGLDPWRAGLIAWLARLVDAISDPLMGRLSDSIRWKIGRRRPFFLIGMIPLGIFFSLMWTTPFTAQNDMFLFYLAIYIGLALSTTIVSIPYMALIPEMATDYDERTSLNTYRSAAAITGTMVAAAFFGVAEWLGGSAEAFATTGLAIGIWMILPWPFVYAASFEKRVLEPATAIKLWTTLKGLARHRTYLRLCFLYVCGRISMDLLGLAIPLFMTIWIGRPGDVHWSLLSMLGVVILSLPLWLRYSQHREKHRIFAAGSIWFAVCLAMVGMGEPSWPRWSIFAISGLLGIGYAVVDLMPWAMIGEVVDENEAITGERSQGVYNGVFTFLRKVGGATAYMVAGFTLSWAGFDKDAEQQPEVVMTTVRLLATAAPAAFLLLGLIAARGYPLTRSRHAQILQRLAARQAASLRETKAG
ncbi:MAG: MFS transporter [Myxococcota bacterium]|nr:MFS transporter [Myxococcota bacterium]